MNTTAPMRWIRLISLVAIIVIMGASIFCLAVPRAHAQEGLSVTVTPPLIQLSIGPGESWTSTLKVVNNNPYDVTYYTQVVDMQAEGEDGQSKFIPIIDESNDPSYQSYALARWIQMSSDPVTIKAGDSANIPFTVGIPQNAEPGGHYAAILVGTEPGAYNQPGTLMRVSSFVSSLIFVRIKGDVVESGRIREFSTGKSLYQTPDVDFTVRFENTGNTHVQPQGDVTIYNMWGKERGQVQINQGDDDFGNVLPQSIRRFQFSWEGEQSLFDIGPYSAIVTLNFGDEGKQNITAKTYFWIVPVVPVSTALGSFILFIFLIAWFIRRYVRRALTLEKTRLGIAPGSPLAAVPTPVIETLIEPIREGVIDLRSIGSKKTPPTSASVGQAIAPGAAQTARSADGGSYESSLTLYQFIAKYRLFIAFLIVCVIGAVAGWWYFARVLQAQRSFQIHDVTIQDEATSTP